MNKKNPDSWLQSKGSWCYNFGMDNKTKAALIKAALIIGGAILLAVLLYTLFHPLHIKIVSENVIKLIPFNMWNHGSGI